MDNVLHARGNIGDFKIFCDVFLSNVVGRNDYKSKVAHTKISDLASCGDEAFAILCVENSIHRWKDEANDKDKRNKANWRTTKYTANPSESSKYGGWSIEGIHRFNSLSRDVIPKLREQSVKLEEDYQKQEWLTRNKAKPSKKCLIETYEEADISYIDPMILTKGKSNDGRSTCESHGGVSTEQQEEGMGCYPNNVGV